LSFPWLSAFLERRVPGDSRLFAWIDQVDLPRWSESRETFTSAQRKEDEEQRTSKCTHATQPNYIPPPVSLPSHSHSQSQSQPIQNPTPYQLICLAVTVSDQNWIICAFDRLAPK
jgi:hypothetical protein